jgi:NAD(P)-dependent dehydrogenase (short-subunit alcohol dehydrogenase family)
MSSHGRAIVTGASSGVGAATARALGDLGWDLALVARRQDRVKELAAQLARGGRCALPVAADLSKPGDAARAMSASERELGSIDALILCHGTNIPRRRLDVLTVEDWDAVIAANLSSVFYCFYAIAPGMRTRGGGRIIAISSVAALRPSTLSGAAYSASKTGLNALCSVINQEEQSNGILATAIAPGDIDTEIMDKRPEPPPPEARARMLQPEDIARIVVQVLTEPDRVLIEEVIVRSSHL